MAAQTYNIDLKVDAITNTKDTSQTEWPRWNPSYSAWSASTIHAYSEWEGTIWGPATTNVIEYTYDDLITKY